MKTVVPADRDRILGFIMTGAEAGEVIATAWTVMPRTRLCDGVIAHPTLEGAALLFPLASVRRAMPQTSSAC